MKAICKNSKTLRSCDFTTICKRSCPYCYVHTARKQGNAVAKRCYEVAYDGDVTRLTQSTIDRLKRCGGMRMFSSADYQPKHDDDIQAMLDDCLRVGLQVKAITKQPAFVRRFHNHPAVRVIHLSVDSIGHGVPMRTAYRMRKQYAKVLIRCVCLDEQDVTRFGENQRIDIITLNHGNNGFHRFSKARHAEIEAEYDGRVCCGTGTCETCTVQCGDPESK